MTRTFFSTWLTIAIRRKARGPANAEEQLGRDLLWQVACEFVGASRKLASHGLTKTEAWELLASYLSAFRLVAPSPEVLERARALHTGRQWSFWDALLVGACLEAGVTTLYSETCRAASRLRR